MAPLLASWQPLWRSTWIMPLRTPKNSLPQDQIFHLHQHSNMFEDLVDFRYNLFP